MDKIEKLKDGTEVTIRRLAPDDPDRLMDFYLALPLEDRKYLKFDVTDRKVVAERLRRVETGDDIRIVAIHGGLIGEHQGLIVKACDVKDLWKELDRLFNESDWQRCR